MNVIEDSNENQKYTPFVNNSLMERQCNEKPAIKFLKSLRFKITQCTVLNQYFVNRKLSVPCYMQNSINLNKL